VTAAALLLDGRARHRTIGAKNAAVARLGFKQCLAIPALVEILARVCRHDFFVLLPAARARKNGLQDDGAHGLAISPGHLLAHNGLVAVCMGVAYTLIEQITGALFAAILIARLAGVYPRPESYIDDETP
jgi:hypothetical protein